MTGNIIFNEQLIFIAAMNIHVITQSVIRMFMFSFFNLSKLVNNVFS